MLPDERMEVKSRLIAARQKIIEIIAEGEAKGIRYQTICQIASVQADLRSAAVKLLCCQIRTTLQTIINPGELNPDEERKKLIEQYQALLKFSTYSQSEVFYEPIE